MICPSEIEHVLFSQDIFWIIKICPKRRSHARICPIGRVLKNKILPCEPGRNFVLSVIFFHIHLYNIAKYISVEQHIFMLLVKVGP